MTTAPVVRRLCAIASTIALALAVACAPPHARPDVGIRAVSTDVVVDAGTPSAPSPQVAP